MSEPLTKSGRRRGPQAGVESPAAMARRCYAAVAKLQDRGEIGAEFAAQLRANIRWAAARGFEPKRERAALKAA